MSWSSEYDPRSLRWLPGTFCALRLSVSARGPLGCCPILLSGYQTVPVDFKTGCRLKRSSSSSHMCSMGDRSGDADGHFRCWMLTLARCCVTNLATCGLALSCCSSVPGPFDVTNKCVCGQNIFCFVKNKNTIAVSRFKWRQWWLASDSCLWAYIFMKFVTFVTFVLGGAIFLPL